MDFINLRGRNLNILTLSVIVPLLLGLKHSVAAQRNHNRFPCRHLEFIFRLKGV
eukprot:XP_001708233.1 Hypothetical protein GL50803_26455 [Giardia lamblia ATCC 50803]